MLTFDDEIDVMISGLTTVRKSISNCPYRIQTLIEDSGLNCTFGHKDHKARYLDFRHFDKRTPCYL